MEGPQPSTDLDGFIALETAVWDALVAGDRVSDAAALHDDFVGLYPSGYANKTEHVEQLADGATVAEYVIEEPRVILVSDDAALFCYLATYLRTGDGATTEQMYVSSLWQRTNGQWLNTFSQDTPASDVRLP